MISVEANQSSVTYNLNINGKKFELSREDAVTLHNKLNKCLKATPVFNVGTKTSTSSKDNN